jgi:hypothetical protein
MRERVQSGVKRTVVVPALALVGILVGLTVVFPAVGTADKNDTRRTLERYARDTWASFAAMTDEETGLPTDRLHVDGTRSVQTSTTNIGAYMWSTLVAEQLGIISHDDAVARLDKTLSTLEMMERYDPNDPSEPFFNCGGQFYNWYDHTTGEKLTVWPPSGEPLTPILSSVDNGWLATALHLVRRKVPELSDRAGVLFDGINFGCYYRSDVNRILFHYAPSTGDAPCCYDTIVSESRIASYIGIAKGELPPHHYFGAWRSFPDTCDWSWQETKPVGFYQIYDGVTVFEGAYEYQDMRIVPSWGGSMFEALMPALFVPEDQWGDRSWTINHPLTVQAHIHHGLEEAQYGYWGFSPANIPEDGYKTYGVDAIGMNPEGYASNNDDTLVDHGFPGCPDRPPQPDPLPSAYTNGVVTPHAAFLALRWAPQATIDNLANLENDFDIYTEWGFLDSVNVNTKVVSPYYLALDQGMIMAAVGNALAQDMLREAFVTDEFQQVLEPVISIEEFDAGPPPTPVGGLAQLSH